MIRVRFAILLLVVLGASAIVYLTGWELTTYFARDLQSAQSAAVRVFGEVCREEGFEAADFYGPSLKQTSGTTYSFIWIAKADSKVTIAVDVSYLPYGVDYYIDGNTAQVRRRERVPILPWHD